MNRRRIGRVTAIGAAAALTVGAFAGCSAGDDTASDGSVTLTFWHNSTTGDGKAYWESTAKAFEDEHPGVTIEIQSIQNEDMDGKLQTALNSGDAPDIFMARGGGKLAAVVEAGQAQDLSSALSDDTKAALGEGALSAFTVDGKLYGVPSSVLPGGVYYSKDLFEQAGITATPTTFDELGDAVDKLKAAGIDPIALGAKDAWPAAHWYYFFALRECSQDVMANLTKDPSFSDECWLRAGEDLQEFADTEPFNQGFLTTTAQQGAGSSAGLVANHKAAMELMGAWDPGVIASLTPDEKPLADLGWFPFPAVDGGDGAAGAMMGGVDGFSCYVDAPKECGEFLEFASQQQYQEGYAEAFVTLPANSEAQGVVTDPALQEVLAAINEAPYVSVWLDTLLGQNVGNALNVGVVDLLAGKGSPQGIVDAVSDAIKKG
ncbi:multiple sugar transport system substrate-binding protein/raffinose/stachyose/melibiose transport system substrate-binding protein [Agromyces terreus]|uniref:Multiple sugar transport system substrate-binding protein/raffinose/stachyose/melibiose transport system substrate-binding protein n=1 Tax=Agromyces terreus TaxID=424795 RepID=A0A9X2KAS2_9MICO|nr:extracellular solute-binding protein [Agromyces terreus]MCP2369566.1 multiple sugar transport system substrate-binding protein/raffinose/stachyose/melibiose transport system substrate-binding protein [Agromyces terreus]